MGDLTLSVLDQSPIRSGGTAAQALRETVSLAQAAERFGYRRFWVAEHHSSSNFAGTAPEVLIGQIAAATSTIRVGSGGVMLTHYSALKVAETFRMLAAFFPGRIDLGIGRAPGSDQLTAAALVYPRPQMDVNQFPRQVVDLLGFMMDRLPEGHPFGEIAAQPGPPLPGGVPDVWLLGSSDYSARLAAILGLPFAFADFFSGAGDIGPDVVDIYRKQFEASEYLAEPRVSAAVHVICADTEERADAVASSMRLGVAQSRLGGGRRGPLLPPEEASRAIADPEISSRIAGFTQHHVVGDKEAIREGLLAAAARYGTDDLIVATNSYSFTDRVRSFELVAEAFSLAAPAPAAEIGSG